MPSYAGIASLRKVITTATECGNVMKLRCTVLHLLRRGKRPALRPSLGSARVIFSRIPLPVGDDGGRQMLSSLCPRTCLHFCWAPLRPLCRSARPPLKSAIDFLFPRNLRDRRNV